MRTRTVALSELTTIRQKGYATIALIDNIDDMEMLQEYFLVGGGSNIVVKNRKSPLAKLSKEFSYIRRSNNTLILGGATPIISVIRAMLKNELSCIEFLAGVPATIGGALRMNAGAFGKSMADIVEYAIIYSSGKLKSLTANQLGLAYRRSRIDGIVVEVALACKPKSRKDLANEIATNIKKRAQKAHLRNTFGSVFKNPEGDYAGRLIEEVGLKGYRHNTAMISPKHANFIVSTQLCEVDDILRLMELAKERVFKNFSIELEEEVIIV